MKYMSLFSGIGGFELGIEESHPDWQCVGYSEIDKYAIQVYEKHFKHKNYGDITTIDTTLLPDFDLLVGGFPCQSFSIAGKRKGFEDTRGTLFFDIARILKDKRPRYLVLENVKGLLSHDSGKTFHTILKVLSDLGYTVEWQVLNSKDFGVPQNRERIFIIGYFGTERRAKILPIQREVRENNKVSHVISETEKVFIKTRFLGQNGSLISKSTTLQASEVPHVIDNSFPSRARVYEDFVPTLSNYSAGGNRMPIVNGIRKLTPIECERLQGFPDNWTEYGSLNHSIVYPEYCEECKTDNPTCESISISDSQRYKCLGNAVTVNVISTLFSKLS